MTVNIKIGGMPFTIEGVDSDLEVCHNASGDRLWGQISYAKHSIRFVKSTPEREFRSVLHEIIHGVVEGHRIRELMNDKYEHLEIPIDQLATGLAEVLESLGITAIENKEEQ